MIPLLFQDPLTTTPRKLASFIIGTSVLALLSNHSFASPVKHPSTKLSMSNRAAAPKPFSCRVISYNVLSSHLATASHYPTLNPDHLKAENRLLVVLEKLEDEISKNGKVVVCLQEVSYDWAGEFHTFFAKKNFHLVTGLYGKPFNGYMGVALAWPTGFFDTVGVDISRLSDARAEDWPQDPERNVFENMWVGIHNFLGDRMKDLGLVTRDVEDPPDHWSLSRSRSNVLLTASLRDKESGNLFSVGTYHMPCAYYCPMAMTIHAELAVQHVHRIAVKQEAPFVLAGDFNIKPQEPVYEFLTTGKLEKESPFYPSPQNDVIWEPKLPIELRSAYAVASGKEPDFTNYAHSKDSEPFIDTLDYIFLSPEWKVESVLKIPHRNEAAGPFPNLDVKEPSDHVLIAADISL